MKKHILRLSAICMIFAMLLSVASILSFTATAAAPTSYSTITAGSSASVSISSQEEIKYFKFVPTQSGTYRFYSSDYSGDPYAILYDASGNELTYDDDTSSDYNFDFSLQHDIL